MPSKNKSSSCRLDFARLLLLSVLINPFLYSRSQCEALNITLKTRSDQMRLAPLASLNSNHKPSSLRQLFNSSNYQSLTNQRKDEEASHRRQNEKEVRHQTSDSILRPQLAVQIFTNSPSGNKQDKTASSHLSSSLRGQHSSNFQKLPQMLIVPVPASINPLDPNDHMSAPAHLEAAQMMHSAQHLYSNSVVGELNPTNKLNPWHYITDTSSRDNTFSGSNFNNHYNSNNENEIDVVTGASNSANDQAEAPMINAIITVPSSPSSSSATLPASTSATNFNNLRQRLFQHQQQQEDLQRQHQRNDSVESALTNLLSNQNSGNIEISMSLNGEELVIDPVSNRSKLFSIRSSNSGNNSSRQQNPSNVKEDEGHNYLQNEESDKSTTNQRKNNFKISNISSKDSSRLSRALRKHFTTNSGNDQQSASEIDQVGNRDENNSDNEDNSQGNEGDLESETSTSKENEKSGIMNDEVERVNSDRLRSWDSPESESSESDLTSKNEPENAESDNYSTESSQADSSRRGNNNSRDRRMSNHLDHRTKKTDLSENQAVGNKDKKSSSSRMKPTHSDQPHSFVEQGKKTSSSKRGSTFRGGGKESIATRPSENDSVDSSLAKVMIKGEDIRKFEQLLESLRALALNNLSQRKSKRLYEGSGDPSSRGSPNTNAPSSAQRHPNEDEHNMNTKNDTEESMSIQGDTSSKTWNSDSEYNYKPSSHQPGKPGPARKTLAQSESNLVKNDCEYQRKLQQDSQHQHKKSASNDEPVFESEPARPHSSNEDANDEGDEQEEQSSDNHQKIINSPKEVPDADSNDSQNYENPLDDEPKSTFVRKTVLHTYDDDDNSKINLSNSEDNVNNNQITNRNEHKDDHHGGDSDLDSIHRVQHEASHQSLSDSEDSQLEQSKPMNQGEQEQLNSPIGRPTGVGDDLTPINNYIDYSQLDDGEIYRGRESRRAFQLALPAREQLEKMRSLQHIIERAAIGSGKSKIRI